MLENASENKRLSPPISFSLQERGQPFTGALAQIYAPHKDLSKQSKTVGQADLPVTVDAQWTCQLTSSFLASS